MRFRYSRRRSSSTRFVGWGCVRGLVFESGKEVRRFTAFAAPRTQRFVKGFY